MLGQKIKKKGKGKKEIEEKRLENSLKTHLSGLKTKKKIATPPSGYNYYVL